jgi:hypothetical protein
VTDFGKRTGLVIWPFCPIFEMEIRKTIRILADVGDRILTSGIDPVNVYLSPIEDSDMFSNR